MKILISIILILLVVFSFEAKAQNCKVFMLKNADYQLSPQTGMTRQHWKDAALYLLEGAFSYVKTLDDPMKFPKQEGKSYPKNEGQVPTEILEGFCRTMFLAAPLLKENPDLTINTIKVGDYYRYQLTKMLDSTSKTYIKPKSKNGGASQILVEFGGLAVSLMAAPEIFWQPLPQDVKEKLAKTMLSYGEGQTIDMNWRFFNINIMSFFKSQGYTIKEDYLKDLIEKTLSHYRGDGWYHDRPYYDYYSMWAFQMYGALWSEFFGKKYYPDYAAQFNKNLREITNSYPYMFSQNGEMIVWGRSILYRMGAAVPFPMLGFLNDQSINYGWIRRIASGTILQFLQNPDFLKDGVPTLGFYGAFEPAVQTYSCRGSAFWLGKLFLGLYTPANSPFWTATENQGDWATMKTNQVYTKYFKGSNLLISDYPNIGAAEIRSTTTSKTVGVYDGTENYNRLSYNSAFPWQADGINGEVSMNYVFKNKKNQWEALRMFTFKKYEDDCFYRDAVLASNDSIKMSLAEIPLANGILRVDKNNSLLPIELRFGHYALPRIGGEIKKTTKKVNGYPVQILDNGQYQVAMVLLSGFDKMEIVDCNGLHPQAHESSVINVFDTFVPTKDAYYVTLMLWKKTGETWKDDELVPIKKIQTDPNSVTITFKKDGKKIIRY